MFDESETASSIQCNTVSVMYVFFITTVMPRAATMTSAAPRKSAAPSMIVFTMRSSPKRAMRPTTTAPTMKSIDASVK